MSFGVSIRCYWSAAACLACFPLSHIAAASGAFDTEVVSITDFSPATTVIRSTTVQWTFPACTNAIIWDQAVASWNASLQPGQRLEIEVQPQPIEDTALWFSFGRWEVGPQALGRQSVPGQERSIGAMQTDTLVLRVPCSGFRLRATLGGVSSSPALLHRVCVAFSGERAAERVDLRAQPRSAWGQSFAVPSLCQMDYEDGGAWCSPTAVAMISHYWALRLQRPELTYDVPQVAAGVMDPAWPGTGNWAFNMAWAGSLEGLVACVVRLTGPDEIEPWLEAGVPLATSVSYGLLRSAVQEPNDGHLVVVIGITDSGDIVVNDPGSHEFPRRIVPRGDFARAWAVSRNTAYILHPASLVPPRLPHTIWRSDRLPY